MNGEVVPCFAERLDRLACASVLEARLARDDIGVPLGDWLRRGRPALTSTDSGGVADGIRG